MTYDDLRATEIIRETWARLMKSLNPPLHAYMVRAKEEYADRGWLDMPMKPVMTIEEVVEWVNEEQI